jgi:hypothetical protein
MVAQIDENDAAVVASRIRPAGQPRLFSVVAAPQFSACVRPVNVLSHIKPSVFL